MSPGARRSTAVPAVLMRGLIELDIRGTRDWAAVVEELHQELTARGSAIDTLHQVFELSMVIQQFLLELACRSTREYTKEQILDATAELLLETVSGSETCGSPSEAVQGSIASFGSGSYTFADCSLDIRGRVLTIHGSPVLLSHVEWSILLLLLSNGGRIVTVADLRSAAWSGVPISGSAIMSAIRALRRKLGDHGQAQTIIRAVRGQGYRFVAEVSVVHPPR